jgi:hypothetical protein
MLGGRIRIGEAITGVAGATLVGSLFLVWFEDSGVGLSAWEAFDVADLILLAVGVAGILLPVLAATQSKSDVPIAGAALIVPAGVLATLLVLYRELDPVGDLDQAGGMLVGLLGALGVAVGAWLAIHSGE